MKPSGAQVLVKSLAALEVRRVFGIPGSQNVELFDALSGGPVETVLVTHELCASYMADATSRCTGNTGVIAVVPGPGLTNAATGIAEAFLDSVPMIVIVPDVRADTDKKFQLHEIAQADLIRPVAKKVIAVTRADDIGPAVADAHATALAGEPGPVVLNIPYNLFMAPAENHFDRGASRATLGDPRALEAAAAKLAGAGKVFIYAGQGALSGRAEVAELSDLLQAPVATTISGRGLVPEDAPLAVGFGYGDQGTAIARDLAREADVVLALGCRFGEVATASYCFPEVNDLIHVDVNPEALGANVPAGMTLCCDARAAAQYFVSRLSSQRRAEYTALKERIRAAKEEQRAAIDARQPRDDGVDPQKFLRALRAHADRDAITTTDSGHHMFCVTPDFEILEPRTLLCPTDYQSMGYSVPAMVAASLAFPGRQVIGHVGDGGFLMTGFELLTAVREGARPWCMVWNDGSLNLIKRQQEKIYGRSTAVELTAPDFKSLAEGLRCDYLAILNDRETEGKIKELITHRRPTVVDVRIRYGRLAHYMEAALAANVRRAPLGQKVRFGARLVGRKVAGILGHKG